MASHDPDSAPLVCDDDTTSQWLDAGGVSIPSGCSYWSGHYVGGPSDGVQVVTLRAGPFEATICPTRGMGVLDFGRRIDRRGIAWTSPVRGPVHPGFVDLASRGGLGWLDGFTELVARCGLSFNGPPGHDAAGPPLEQDVTLHGRIANRSATGLRLSSDGEGLAVHGTTQEATLFGANLVLESSITLRPDGTLHVHDVVRNASARDAEMQLLYHINLDPAAVGENPTLTPPAGEMQPRDAAAEAGLARWTQIDSPTAGYAEQVFFVTPTDEVAITRLEGTAGAIEVRQSRATLPALSLWKCFQPRADGYVLGIEPGTGFPNFKADERDAGRVVTLAAGQTQEHSVTIAIERNDPE